MGFFAATLTESEDLNERLRQIKAARKMPGQPFEIDKIAIDILHRLAAGADQMVVRVEIAVDTQDGCVRRHLA